MTNRQEIALIDFLSRLEVGAPRIHGDVSVYPVFTSMAREDGYALLGEALATGRFTVNEVSETARVSELSVRNGLDSDVLLLDGEQLVGAKRNRIVDTTIVIGKGRKVAIPVPWAEQERRAYRTRFLGDSGAYPYADLRSSNAHEIRRHEDAFRPVDGQAGFVVAIRGRVVGGDIFGIRSVFRKSYPRLLKGYVLKALDGRIRRCEEIDRNLEPDLVKGFLAGVAASRQQAFVSMGGEGRDIRLEGMAIHGFCLVRDGQVLHLAAFSD